MVMRKRISMYGCVDQILGPKKAMIFGNESGEKREYIYIRVCWKWKNIVIVIYVTCDNCSETIPMNPLSNFFCSGR